MIIRSDILLAWAVLLCASDYTPTYALEYTPPTAHNNVKATGKVTTTIDELKGIELAYEHFRTWAHGIDVKELLLVAYPKDEAEILTIVNWARDHGRKVRPTGNKHSFPPLTVTEDAVPSEYILVDLTKHLTKMEMTQIPAERTIHNKPLKAVTAETGASWEDFLTFCEKHNAGLAHSVIIGDATVGGVLAIGTHGAAIPAAGEQLKPGMSFGSLSNLIASFNAVVWDVDKDAYVIKHFSRSDPDSSAFLAHVGRAFLTKVTLIVGDNYNLRVKSIVDIPADELFANPESTPNATRTFASFLEKTGRADVQWYQFTKFPWLKLWNIEKEKPSECREVYGPYNYQFPVNANFPSKTVPELGQIAFDNLVSGLRQKDALDMWGPSKNIILYSNGSSQSIVYGGFVVLTSRSRIQSVLSTIVDFYNNLNEEYAAKNQYPIDYYIKFRVTGLDNPRETKIKDASATLLSPISVPAEYPDFDVAVWMNTFTSRENPQANTFMRRFEQFYFATFNGPNGIARPEWSKSWAYTDNGPFVNRDMLTTLIQNRYGAGWKKAMSILNKYDPIGMFSNEFLDVLMK